MAKTYNPIIVIARHSMIAGCEGGTRGSPEFESTGSKLGLRARTPRSSRRPPKVGFNGQGSLLARRNATLTIPILGQPSHILQPLELPFQDPLDGFHEAVRRPSGEFMERY